VSGSGHACSFKRQLACHLRHREQQMPSFTRAFPLILLLVAAPLALAGTHSEGLKWLEENKAKPGVITLPSGLQYKVLKHGSGLFHPTVNSPCECHYAGTLIDGTEFDSSYKRGEPTTFAPNQVTSCTRRCPSNRPPLLRALLCCNSRCVTASLQVIKGWTEAMQLMVEGDKWEMYARKTNRCTNIINQKRVFFLQPSFSTG
jgi:FKBP-type peptidyl-prolyl cis-trans isomerase FklB